MKEQEVQFRKRLQDLARTAYYREIPVFTDFLDLNELHMVCTMRRAIEPRDSASRRTVAHSPSFSAAYLPTNSSLRHCPRKYNADISLYQSALAYFLRTLTTNSHIERTHPL